MIYLIDTDVSVFSIKGKYRLKEKFLKVGFHNCWLSEITKAELLYSVSNSESITENRMNVEGYLSKFEFLPIKNAHLKSIGNIIPDFDLLIGVTAIYCSLTLVTHNTRHFSRLRNIQLEDWVINN